MQKRLKCFLKNAFYDKIISMKRYISNKRGSGKLSKPLLPQVFVATCLLIVFVASFFATSLFFKATQLSNGVCGVYAEEPEKPQNSQSEILATTRSASLRDNVFSVVLTGLSRNGSALDFSQTSAADYLEQDHLYLVANWKDLLAFNFAINGQNTSNRKMTSYNLRVQYVKTDNFLGVVWPGTTKTITSDIISTSAQSYSTTFGFNVDGMNYDGQVYGGGYGYGLYHFTFSYMFMPANSQSEPSQNSQSSSILEATLSDGFYVAVLPDDPKNIRPKDDIRLLYSESNSNQLLNKYAFKLSDNSFNYIKDELIEWDATGVDVKGVKYCLTEYSKAYQPLYSNHIVLYPIFQNPTGKTFEFDSCGIEGVWTITCTIKNNDGTVRLQLYKSNISTYKTEIKSFDPTITIIIVLAVVLGVLALIVVVLAIQLFRDRKL